MKIYLGLNNAKDLKVASSVADKGLNLLKCQPWNHPIMGLRRVVQPGFDTYTRNLPSYMKATETGMKRAISSLGNGVKLAAAYCLPVKFPPLFIMVKKGKKAASIITDGNYNELYSNKSGIAYSTEFSPIMLKLATHSDIDPSAFPSNRHIKLTDGPIAVRVLQIISSFLQTHRYPAFKDNSREILFSERSEVDMYTYKRSAEVEDFVARKVLIEVKLTPHGSFHGPYTENILSSTEQDAFKIEFKVAKPTISSVSPWGLNTEIPTTEGIHFPFEEDLAQPDPNTVPSVIEEYFLSCLHDDPETCISAMAQLRGIWASTICRTTFGHEMSHLYKITSLAMKCQARVFPIIHNHHYLGCYLSGSCFSVGIKGKVYRPETYEQNFKEIECYSANDSVLQKIAEYVTDKDDWRKKILKTGGNLRELGHLLVKNFALGNEKQEKVVEYAKLIRPATPYMSISAVNLIESLDGIIEKTIPDKEKPIYAGDIFKILDPFTSWMSVFGQNVPSVEIPMAPRWKIESSKIPEKFRGQFAVRLCSMDMARAEWLKLKVEKVIHNAPERISAIYEHTTIKGVEDRKEVWKKIFEWSDSTDTDKEGSKGQYVDSSGVEVSGHGRTETEKDPFANLGF
jgi:hypothetical protein